jgi:CRISPR-associated protein Cas1
MPTAKKGKAWREAGEARTRQAERKGRPPYELPPTLILAGHGVALRVERNALVVKDGLTHSTQQVSTTTLHRGVHGVERIVIRAESGSLSLDALTWCREQGVAVTIIDSRGRLAAALVPRSAADVAFHRRQYTLSEEERAGIVRWIVQCKLQGQRDILLGHPHLPSAEEATDVIRQALAWYDLPTLPPWMDDVATLRLFEARTTGAYYGSWIGWPLKWRQRDLPYIPPHWKAIRQRTSPLTQRALAGNLLLLLC